MFFPGIAPTVRTGLFFCLDRYDENLFRRLDPILFRNLLPCGHMLIYFQLCLDTVGVLFLRAGRTLFDRCKSSYVGVRISTLCRVVNSGTISNHRERSLTSAGPRVTGVMFGYIHCTAAKVGTVGVNGGGWA